MSTVRVIGLQRAIVVLSVSRPLLLDREGPPSPGKRPATTPRVRPGIILTGARLCCLPAAPSHAILSRIIDFDRPEQSDGCVEAGS